MAVRQTTTGLEDVTRQLAQLEMSAQGVAAASLYEGAAVMADAYAQAVNAIEDAPFQYAFNGRMRKPSPEEKAALQGATGVAKFRKNGDSVDTSVGLQNAGYTTINGKTKPIPQIANAINSGTSFMQKQPVFRQAASKAKQRAQAAIKAKGEAMLSELTK